MCDDAEALILAEKRNDSPDDFIEYLCRGCRIRNENHAKMRNDPLFVKHCKELYHQQNGLCAITKVKMHLDHIKKDDLRLSLYRIDKSKGFQIGNMQIVCWWVGNAIGSHGLDTLKHFANAVCAHASINASLADSRL